MIEHVLFGVQVPAFSNELLSRTDQLAAGNRVFLENLRIGQLLKKFAASYGAASISTVLTTTRQLLLSWASWKSEDRKPWLILPYEYIWKFAVTLQSKSIIIFPVFLLALFPSLIYLLAPTYVSLLILCNIYVFRCYSVYRLCIILCTVYVYSVYRLCFRCYSVYRLCVILCTVYVYSVYRLCVILCTLLLPPGASPLAVY
jgi:hypothetical protein